MKKFALVCFCSLLLSACFSGRSPNSSFYMLEQLAQNKISDKKISILVEQIKLPELIDRPQIVLKEENSPQISISEFNRWGEPLSNVIRQTLIGNLSTYLPNAFIKPDNYDTSGKFDYTLLVEVNKFIGEKNNAVYLDVWWTVKNSKGKIIAREKSTFETFMEKDYASYVEAQSYNLDELSIKIAKLLEK